MTPLVASHTFTQTFTFDNYAANQFHNVWLKLVGEHTNIKPVAFPLFRVLISNIFCATLKTRKMRFFKSDNSDHFGDPKGIP